MPSTSERAGVPVGRLSLFIRLFIALGLAMLAAPLLTSSASAEPDPNQVVVCKYSHTPETGEVAQTIIIVSINALEGEGFDGTFPFLFSDEHNSSIAIRHAEVGENANDLEIGECPPFPGVDDCPDLPGDQPVDFQCEPLSERETQDVGPIVDCPADTVTTLHQERTRTQTFVDGAWVFGDWTPWTTFDTTVVEATDAQCPPEVVLPPDPVNPPNPPNPPVVNPPNPVNPPVVNPPAPVNPPPAPVSAPTVLPQTGGEEILGALALLTGLAMLAGAGLVRRSRKLGVPTT